MWGKNNICKICKQGGGAEAIFRVHFGKLLKNDFKSTISFKAPTNLPQKNWVKFNMQYITAMKCITTHKKIREIGGALGKN